MIKEIVSLSSRVSALALVSIAIGAAPLSLHAEPQDEIAQLRAEIEKLLARVSELEARQAAAVAAPVVTAPASAPASQGAPAPARAAVAWRWSGDLRYRSEFIEIGTAPDRQRDRIRARFGFTAEVSEGVSATVRVATSDGLDPRVGNATLGQLGERKTFGVEHAYLRWQPSGELADWQVTAGKMPTPWQVTPGLFLDTDVYPEGLALAWQGRDTGFFASAFYVSLTERSQSSDSTLLGAQLGWQVTPDAKLALGYFDYQTMQGADPFLNRNASLSFGNSLTSGAACRAGIARCLLQDFDVLQGLVDYRTERFGWPLRLHAEYARNLAYDSGLFAIAGQTAEKGAGDEAYSLGVTLGETNAPGSMQWSVIYQETERDALFAPWLDADFASGFSASSGMVLRFGYALTPRWRLNASWFNTERELTVGEGAAADTGTERREQRLQLDVNTRF